VLELEHQEDEDVVYENQVQSFQIAEACHGGQKQVIPFESRFSKEMKPYVMQDVQ